MCSGGRTHCLLILVERPSSGQGGLELAAREGMELTATAHDRARSSLYDGERPAVGLGGELPGSPEWMELAATASSRAGLSKRQRRTGREASGASMEASVQTGWAGQRLGGMGRAAGSGCGDCRCFDLALRNEDGGADDVVCWAGGKLAGTAGGR